jgi:hypothetical protein
MSEPPSDPIPSELSQAFYEAALLCHDGLWSPAHPEYPTVRVKAKAYTIREVWKKSTGRSKTCVIGERRSSSGEQIKRLVLRRAPGEALFAAAVGPRGGRGS